MTWPIFYMAGLESWAPLAKRFLKCISTGWWSIIFPCYVHRIIFHGYLVWIEKICQEACGVMMNSVSECQTELPAYSKTDMTDFFSCISILSKQLSICQNKTISWCSFYLHKQLTLQYSHDLVLSVKKFLGWLYLALPQSPWGKRNI